MQRADPLFPRQALWILVGILIVGAAVRLYTFNGFGGLDDAEYARFAYLLAKGQPFPQGYEGPAVFPIRVGIIVPTAIAFRFLGATEWTSIIYPFVVSLASIVVGYLVATLMFGWRAGLVAAGLFGIFYWDIDSATKLLPDLPAAFLSGAGMALILFVVQRTDRASALLAGGLGAGLAFGLSWLTKESVAYLAPGCLIIMVLTVRQRGRSMWLVWGGVAAASLAVLATEAIVHYRFTGDLLFRFHEVERNYQQWDNGFFTEGSDQGWAAGTNRTAALARRLFVTGPRTILLDESFYYVPFVGLVAVMYGWWRRDRGYLIPAIWLCSVALMFNFMSSSMSSYLPLALFNRYLSPIFLPAIVLAAGLLARTLLEDSVPRRLGSMMLGIAAMLLILSAAVPRLYFTLRTSHSAWAAEVRSLGASLTPDTVVYADALTLRGLEFFKEYPKGARWTSFEQLPPGAQIPDGSAVIVNPRYIDWLDRNAGMWVTWPGAGPTQPSSYPRHAFYDHVPDGWATVWKNGNTRMYRVSRENGEPQ